jgi:hypothetical protein
VDLQVTKQSTALAKSAADKPQLREPSLVQRSGATTLPVVRYSRGAAVGEVRS